VIIVGMPRSRPTNAGVGAWDEMSTVTSAPANMTMMVRPGLAPLIIMTGRAGAWMVSYQFMLDEMDGNLSGTTDVSSAQILRHFNFAPLNMTMQMHMLMVMSPLDQLNFTAAGRCLTQSARSELVVYCRYSSPWNDRESGA
jgi:hypothetical protein